MAVSSTSSPTALQDLRAVHPAPSYQGGKFACAQTSAIFNICYPATLTFTSLYPPPYARAPPALPSHVPPLRRGGPGLD